MNNREIPALSPGIFLLKIIIYLMYAFDISYNILQANDRSILQFFEHRDDLGAMFECFSTSFADKASLGGAEK